MSNVNIKRAIEHIRAVTTVYTPIAEVIVNAIQAIEDKRADDGKVTIRALRSDQLELDEGLPEINGFEIADNGIGFTNEHRDSFDTLYTDLRIAEGAKGFGRFTCLRYFENVHVESVFKNHKGHKLRTFSMGKENDIIVNEKISRSDAIESGTTVRLLELKQGRSIDKKLSTIARNLVEKLLPYFIARDYTCPDIVLYEKDGAGRIRLNDYVTNELAGLIKELPVEDASFTLKGIKGDQEFLVRVFKFYYPRWHKSRISLVAHKREVSGSALHTYIPEFVEEFYEKDSAGNADQQRNYIVKAYVFGAYLDDNVSLERGGFEFHKDNDVLFGISQTEIEARAAEIARATVGTEIDTRADRKKERIQSYVDEQAPWHKGILEKIDLTKMPYNPSNEEIEARLQKEKFAQETQIKRDVASLLTETNVGDLRKNVPNIVRKISGNSRSELIHYIALRRAILDIFGKSLEVDEDGQYSAEGIVHDIIFPRKGDSDTTSFEDHNLWIVDERLNFTEYVSSDVSLGGKNADRPDLLVYDKRILFRGDNAPSNPVTIFEFKKPQRDDFVNASSKEDPVQQIVRYVNDIRDGKYTTPQGRNIRVADNTPFYGYVVCDLTAKVVEWLRREKNFKPMPDGLGWFQWVENINLYVEVLSWEKVLNDAKMRNRIFFHKLGI